MVGEGREEGRYAEPWGGREEGKGKAG